MKKQIISTAAVTAIFFSIVLPNCRNNTSNDSLINTQTQSTYSRVINEGKIRAAYTIYPPGCMKDSTGKLVGVFIETLERAAQNLDLKVEWTEEVGWATQIEGLETNRYDMIGSSVWANPKRAKLTTLSTPLYYSPIHIYTRSSDKTYDNLTNFSLLNNESVKIATIDGGTGEVIAKNQFPKATRVSLPQLTDFSQSFLDVVTKKADIVFMEPFHASKFLASNAKSIKCVTEKGPVRVFANCYMFKRNEVEFEHMLNVVLEDVMNSGYVEQLLAKYEKYPGSYYRVAKPYQILK